LREVQRLRVFENIVLRKIFGPKEDDVTGSWRMLHSENLNYETLTKYYSGDQVNKNKIGVACSKRGRQERCIQDFGGET
jgi:hypothetical protein